MNYAVIENGVVVNIIVWDGNADTWQPAAGQVAVPASGVPGLGRGWTYDSETFSAPAQP